MPALKPLPSVKRTKSGLGLVANRSYKKDDFVIEYTGELITTEEADRRGNKYLVDIDKKWALDGSGRENLARYINHSCRPNCIAEVDEDDRRVFIYAKKKIEPGDELTFNYGKEYFDQYIKPVGCKCEKCAGN